MNINNCSLNENCKQFKVCILINKQLYRNILFKKIIQKHVLTCFNFSKITFFDKNNWFSVFSNACKSKIIFVIDLDGFLPFLFFSKQKNRAVSIPIDPISAYLSRAHNNSNICILALNNIKASNINDIITKYCCTKFEGGRHLTRLSIMHNSFKKSKKIIKFNTDCKRTIVLCSDHAGYNIKQTIIKHLTNHKYNVIDVGTFSQESTHYSLYAIAMLQHVQNAFCGIAICFTGFGIANTCNKFKGALSCICSNVKQAKIAREKYGANILAIGSRNVTPNNVNRIVDAFIDSNQIKPNIHLLQLGYSFSYQYFSKLKIDKKLLPLELKKFS
jgi:ribose 5-phosphate isomerase B